MEEAREGRQGIYVRSITVGGVADKDGQLSVGDQILEVQDKNLTDVHYEKVLDKNNRKPDFPGKSFTLFTWAKSFDPDCICIFRVNTVFCLYFIN